MDVTSELAWAAGLFEGEGSVYKAKRHARYAVGMTMTDEDVIRRFARVVGVGRVYGPYSYARYKGRETYKTYWQWVATASEDVETLHGLIRHWLGQRRGDRFDEAIEWNRAVAEDVDRQRDEMFEMEMSGISRMDIARTLGLSIQRVTQAMNARVDEHSLMGAQEVPLTT